MSYCLYRCFDKGNKPIYIGKSLSLYRRICFHKDHSHWFDEVSFISITRYSDHDSLRVAEKSAIRHERPKYNLREMETENQKKLRLIAERAMKRNLAKLAAAKKAKA